MLETLIVSQILLWLIVIALAIVCLALVRQVGILYERIAPAGALAMNKQLAGGDKAPRLSVETLTGQTLQIGFSEKALDNAKSQLVFFLSPTCPVCKTLLPILKSIRQHESSWLDIVLASDGDEDHSAFIRAQSLGDFPYVVSKHLGMSYGVSKLPYGVLIDEKGNISALGIVNSREHLESLFEAKALGKATIQDYLSGIETQKKMYKSAVTGT